MVRVDIPANPCRPSPLRPPLTIATPLADPLCSSLREVTRDRGGKKTAGMATGGDPQFIMPGQGSRWGNPSQSWSAPLTSAVRRHCLSGSVGFWLPRAVPAQILRPGIIGTYLPGSLVEGRSKVWVATSTPKRSRDSCFAHWHFRLVTWGRRLFFFYLPHIHTHPPSPFSSTSMQQTQAHHAIPSTLPEGPNFRALVNCPRPVREPSVFADMH